MTGSSVVSQLNTPTVGVQNSYFELAPFQLSSTSIWDAFRRAACGGKDFEFAWQVGTLGVVPVAATEFAEGRGGVLCERLANKEIEPEEGVAKRSPMGDVVGMTASGAWALTVAKASSGSKVGGGMVASVEASDSASFDISLCNGGLRTTWLCKAASSDSSDASLMLPNVGNMHCSSPLDVCFEAWISQGPRAMDDDLARGLASTRSTATTTDLGFGGGPVPCGMAALFAMWPALPLGSTARAAPSGDAHGIDVLASTLPIVNAASALACGKRCACAWPAQ